MLKEKSRSVAVRNASAFLGLCGAVLLAALATGCGGSSNNTAATATTQPNLIVTDSGNSRGLLYKPPLSTGMNAHRVYGQTDFTSGSCNQGGSLSATTLCHPYGVAVDPSGNGWVADFANDRVLEYPNGSGSGAAASLVLGEPDFVTDTKCSTSSASSMCGPLGVVSDKHGDIWVADTFACRVLEFKPPFTNGMAASLVIGKQSLTNNCGTLGDFDNGPSGLQYARFLTFDKSGNLWVSDEDNARVLEFSPPFSTGMNATAVLGEPDFVTNTGCNATTANSICEPYGVAFDSSGNLWVGDHENCRALRYSPPFTNGMAASLVLGQANFTDDCVRESGQDGLGDAVGIALDTAGNVYVADSGNNRVMGFSPPFSNGMNASLVIGQPDFTTTTANTTQNGLNYPIGLSIGNTP